MTYKKKISALLTASAVAIILAAIWFSPKLNTMDVPGIISWYVFYLLAVSGATNLVVKLTDILADREFKKRHNTQTSITYNGRRFASLKEFEAYNAGDKTKGEKW